MSRADIFVRIATQGLVGFGAAPGTMATVMMIPMAYYLGNLNLSTCYHVLLCSILFLSGAYVVHRVLPIFDNCDASAIVLDEMVSFLFVFIGLPITMASLMVGFGLFRFFDIFKPLGINYVERLPGFYGVMGDDLAAALVSNIILHFLLYVRVL